MYSGDGGQAVAAGMNNPTDIAIDAAGNIFITDQESVVRMVREIVCAVHTAYWEPRIISPSIFVLVFIILDNVGQSMPSRANSGLHTLYIITRFQAPPSPPHFSSSQVNVTTGIISTVVSGLKSPQGLAFDKSGSLFISDSYNGYVFKVSQF